MVSFTYQKTMDNNTQNNPNNFNDSNNIDPNFQNEVETANEQPQQEQQQFEQQPLEQQPLEQEEQQYSQQPQQEEQQQYSQQPQQQYQQQYNQYNQQNQYYQRPQQQYQQPYNNRYSHYNQNAAQASQYGQSGYGTYSNHQNYFSALKPALSVDATKVDMIFGLLIFIALFLVTRWGFDGQMALGFSISTTVLTIATFFYLVKSNFKIKAFSIICAITTIACASVYSLYLTSAVRIILFFVIIGFYTLMVITTCGFLEYPLGSYGIILDIVKSVLVYPFKFIAVPFRSFFSKNKKKENNKAKQILFGVLLALPALIVILPLLISSDYAFEHFITKVFGDLGRIIVQLIFAFILFSFVFAMIFANVKNLDKTDEKANKKVRSHPFEVVATTSFLAIISLVYLSYLLSQLAYFTNAFQRLLPKEFFASEYARRGFFEMCVIICINIAIVGIVMLNIKRVKKNDVPTPIKISLTFILIFSVVIIFTALSKMWMYIDRFGMTHLRILTTVFMVMSLFVLLFIAIRIFVVKFAYMKGIIVSCLIIGLFVSFVDVDTLVAGYNTEMYLSGKHDEIDVHFLKQLDDSAVPSLIKLIDSENEETRKEAIKALKRFSKLKLEFTYDEDAEIHTPIRPYFEFMSLNKTRYTARMLLYENYSRFSDNDDDRD